jgi:hypothetical protein
MFAVAAAVIAFLAIIGLMSFHFMLWLWLMFVALHFAWPFYPWTRKTPPQG